MIYTDNEEIKYKMSEVLDVALYADVFTKIKSEVVEAARELIPAIWKVEDVAEKEKMMRDWLMKACLAYGVNEPEFEFRPKDVSGYRATGGGCYFPDDNRIVLYRKASAVTLFHEFRHMLQFKAGVRRYKNDYEHDARAWSVSLFKKARPKSYERAVNKGILHLA